MYLALAAHLYHLPLAHAFSLALAQYPWRPRFPDWASCYTHLYELNGIGDRGLMRGLNNWYRFYSKPIATPTASK